MKFRERIKEILYQDVASENETKRTAVILRFTAIIMCCYFLLTMLSFLIVKKMEMLFFAIPCLSFYGCLFYLTYKNKAAKLVLSVNIVTVVWMLCMIYLLGWDCGVQHFIFVLIVLNFTTSIHSTQTKIFCAVVLSILRIALYVYTMFEEPIRPLTIELKIILQVLNTGTICSIIIASLLLYTKDSRIMEKKLIMYNEKLQRLASLDHLTGLSNRRYMAEYMEEKSKLYISGKYNAISVAIADIDYFKKINDLYGHDCGDMVLKQLSGLFDDYMRSIGIVGRWGGEEFLFVFINENGDQAFSHLLRIQCLIRQMEWKYNNELFRITLTFGLAEYDSNKKIEMIIKEADDKLYRGKEEGRDRVIF